MSRWMVRRDTSNRWASSGADPLLLEQKGKNPDQTFGFHWDTPLSALRAIVWGHYTTGTRQLSVLFG